MHLLGKNLPDQKLVRVAVLAFKGIGKGNASRLIARLSIHDSCLVSQLTESQTTDLASYLSSPGTHEGQGRLALAMPRGIDKARNAVSQLLQRPKGWTNRMDNLLIENDLNRSVNEAISHHQLIGTYRGKRMVQGFPVNGGNTRSNGRTASRLNKVKARIASRVAS